MKLSTKLLAILNLISFLGMVTVNALANILPINGVNTGELSALYPNLFVPAGFTFAIWGVIYLLLGMFVVTHVARAFSAFKDNVPFTQGIGIWFVLSCLGNAGWIFAWHYKMVLLSLGVMLFILVCLCKIYFGLKIGRGELKRSNRLLIHLPFSVYLGWIIIATVANVTAVLVSYHWDGFGLPEVAWAMLVIVVATMVALWAILDRGDIFLSLVTVWALFGILMKTLALHRPEIGMIISTSVGMGLIILSIAERVFRGSVYK
ncbi:MAG: hypothetical protein H6581_28315 [Bacteroidia bacterium]|nr:hypothetical protein [Bacteroidia bacterium]